VTKGNGLRDPNVTSLDEARRQKAEQEQAAKRASRVATGSTIGQRVFGLVMVAMALGFLVWFVGGFDGTPVLVEESK
jgi:uncharacterized membrane protein